ncbi:MAG: hypothetical protein AAF502_05775 [Bacteroidota bacterium]
MNRRLLQEFGRIMKRQPGRQAHEINDQNKTPGRGHYRDSAINSTNGAASG